LKIWLDEQELLPKSLIGQAATYTRNQWDALERYLEDGDLSIDNNVSERCVKPVAIGRKNWLFVGSEQAGARAARLMSLVASCKAGRVEPWAYLRDLFTQLPALVPIDGDLAEFDSLLPDRSPGRPSPAPLDHRRPPPTRTRRQRRPVVYRALTGQCDQASHAGGVDCPGNLANARQRSPRHFARGADQCIQIG